jgi:hypothetical protein
LAVGLLGLWAIGRGTSLLCELDRGTLELLLSQPVTRRIVNLSQVIFDFICWPVLGLCLCGGLAIGTWWISPIREKPVNGEILEKIEASKPWWMRFEFLNQKPQKTERPFSDRMQLSPPVFLKAAPAVAALGFAMSGISFAIASFGRSRIKVLGILATLFFLMYLANLLAQLFEPMEWIRPLTVFYYYHPQELALGQGDFIRLQTATLGYKIPANLTKLGITNLRVYAQANNAFLWTEYAGVDPEISTNGDTNLASGIERNSIPQSRAFTIGLNIGL